MTSADTLPPEKSMAVQWNQTSSGESCGRKVEMRSIHCPIKATVSEVSKIIIGASMDFSLKTPKRTPAAARRTHG